MDSPIISYFAQETPFLERRGGYRMLNEHSDVFVGVDGRWSTREVSPPEAKDCLRIVFYDGEALTVSAGTLVETHRSTKPPVVCTAAQLYQRFTSTALWRKSKTEDHDPVRLPAREPWFDPYYIGLYLGDGCKNNGTITVGPEDQSAMAHLGHLSRWDCHGTRYLRVEGAYRALRVSGHLGWKGFLPEVVFNSEGVRLSALQGLCDSDGSVVKGQGTCCFFNTDHSLIDMVRVICWLQGWDVTENLMKRSDKDVNSDGARYSDIPRLNFRADKPAFRLARKLIHQRPAMKEGRAKRITSIEPVGLKECIGISGHSVLAGYSLKVI